MGLFTSIIPSPVIRAMVLSTARHIATAASGVLVTYLLAHGASQGDADSISQAVAAVILGLASYGFSLWDVKNVDKKMTQAEVATAVTVSTAVKQNKSVAKDINDAANDAASGSPAAMKTLLQQLAKGQL